MRPWIDGAHFLRAGVLAVSLPSVAAAQESLFERLNLDRLRLTSFGVGTGPVDPSRVQRTQAYSIHADYGEITRNWRVVFTVTYWGSDFDEKVVREFEDRLRGTIVDPAGDDTLEIGLVAVSDIALEVEMRRMLARRGPFRPYLAAGVGAHAINAENEFIRGTFVESALDNIATGFVGAVGVETAPVKRLSVGAQARYNMLSNVRFGSLRVLASYYFNVAQLKPDP